MLFFIGVMFEIAFIFRCYKQFVGLRSPKNQYIRRK